MLAAAIVPSVPSLDSTTTCIWEVWSIEISVVTFEVIAPIALVLAVMFDALVEMFPVLVEIFPAFVDMLDVLVSTFPSTSSIAAWTSVAVNPDVVLE